MPPTPNVGNLTPAEWQELQVVLSRFERAWQAGGRADPAEFVPADGRLGVVLLLELLKSDLEVRWQRGERPTVEEYLPRFPGLRAEPGLLPPLLAEEYRVRHLYGDRPALDSYKARFPDQFAEVMRLVCDLQMTVTLAPPTLPPQAAPTRPPLAPLGMPQAGLFLAGGAGYKLLNLLGSGSFGEVWRAEAPGGVEVAVKIVFRPLDAHEAQRELKALNLVRKLRHPFLVQLQAAWSLDNRLYIAMELAESSLRRRLDQCVRSGGRGIPVPELLGYLRQAGGALDHAHAHGVLHRDIKPDNVLLSAGFAKVADFGLACLLDGARSFSATTCGSAPYMAPEIWLGRACAQTDQYSLAATYVHLRLNRLLYTAGSQWELMARHREGKPHLPELSEAERAVVLRALAREPDQRYPSCVDFCAALEKALGEGSVVGGPAPAPPEPGPMDTEPLQDERLGDGEQTTSAKEDVPAPPRKRHRALLWAPVALLPLLVAAAALFIRQEPFPPPGFIGKGQLVDANGKRVPERLEYVLPDTSPVVFLLMRQEDPGDPPPFYIMRNKVSNHVFNQVSAGYPGGPWGPEWRWGGRDEQQKRDLLVNENPDTDERPVFRVRVDAAHAFARLLGGELPTPRQLDKAGGKFRGAKGPFRGTDRPDHDPEGLALHGLPKPVLDAGPDESMFGCQNLASNGYEWTSCVWHEPGPGGTREDDAVDFAKEQRTDIIVRGMTYRESRPFLFGMDPLQRARVPNPNQFDQPQDDISFRVVIPIPGVPDRPVGPRP
jgi:hypothetical protein